MLQADYYRDAAKEVREERSDILDRVATGDAPEPWSHHALTYAKGDKLEPSLSNIVTILSQHPDWAGVIAFDAFSSRIVATRQPPWSTLTMPADGARAGEWRDEDDSRAAMWLEAFGMGGVQTSKVGEAVQVVARVYEVHPVRDYLNGLAWDGTERIGNWLTAYVGTEETSYTRLVGRLWLISAVARVMVPGSKADHMLVLEGDQGTNKSSALRTLAGASWFYDDAIDLDSKDGKIALRGRWIVELAELDSLRRSDVERVKAFLTVQEDRYRPPYGRRDVDVPRQCVFAGTTNNTEYLRDATGNRRFWPVKCGAINLDALSLDRDQLWAEAVHAYRADAAWWPRGSEEIALCGEAQEARYQGDTWETEIANWLLNRAERTTKPFTMSDVLTALGIQTAAQDRPAQTRAGAILARLGATKGGQKSDGKGTRERVYTCDVEKLKKLYGERNKPTGAPS